jgi:hypothetical protein
MAKKTKARSTTKPTARTRSPKKPAPKRAARPRARRPEKKRTRSSKVPLAPKPSDMKRPAPGEPVRIQPPPELAQGRHDTTLEETAAPPHTDESAREAAMEHEPPIEREPKPPSDVPERRRAPARTALDANRWVHRRQNQPRGNPWQARGHSTMRGR